MSRNWKRVLIIALLVACLVAAWFLWGTVFTSETPESRPTVEDSPIAGSVSGAVEGAGDRVLGFSPSVAGGAALSESERPGDISGNPIKAFTINASRNGFSVERIVVARGDRVQFNVVASEGKYDLAVALPIGGYVVAEEGKTASLGFDAQTVGTYEFACRLFCPEGAILKGQVIITE